MLSRKLTCDYASADEYTRSSNKNILVSNTIVTDGLTKLLNDLPDDIVGLTMRNCYCMNENDIVDISVLKNKTKLKNITLISCNPINSLVGLPSSIEELTVCDTPIVSFRWSDLSAFDNLVYLNLSDGNIKTVPENCTVYISGLEYLNLSYNHIDDEQILTRLLKNLPKIKTINLTANPVRVQIDEFVISSHDSIEKVYLTSTYTENNITDNDPSITYRYMDYSGDEVHHSRNPDNGRVTIYLNNDCGRSILHIEELLKNIIKSTIQNDEGEYYKSIVQLIDSIGDIKMRRFKLIDRYY